MSSTELCNEFYDFFAWDVIKNLTLLAIFR